MNSNRVSHYEIRDLLGRGGMGEVYEAFDLKAKRTVAIKFVAAEVSADTSTFKRFESEALNAAQLNHPHIATLYEFEPEGQRPFIVMERVHGPSLRQRIREGPLPVAEALNIARDVASALAYAHRRGIVHRDIKPENLMFDEDGRIKVMDFGLARALLDSRLTVTGTHLGTPSYMSPESVSGASVPASDVFALGLVFHEMLTGEQAFQGDSPLAVMYAIANESPPPVRTKCPDAPLAVEQLIAHMLERDPEQRIVASTAARALAELTGGSLPDLSSLPGTPVSDAARAQTDGQKPPPAPARSPKLGWAAAGAGALLLSALAVWMATRPKPSASVPVESVMLNNQALAAIRQGDLIRAQELIAASLEKAPSYGHARFNLARIYALRGELDSAAAVYHDILRTHSDNRELVAGAHYNLGDVNLRSGAVEQAVSHFRSSFEVDSAQARSYNDYGYALVMAHRPQEALALLERGVSRFPSAAPLLKNAGFAALGLDRDTLALHFLDRAIRIDSNLPAAFGLRARVNARLGRKEAALDDWSLFIACDPPPSAEERAEVSRDLAVHGFNVAP